MILTSNRLADVLILSAIFALLVVVFPVHAYDVTFSPVGSIIPMCGTGAGTYCSGQSVWNNRTTTAGIGSSTAAHMIFSADTPNFYSDVEYRCSNGGDWGARNYLSSGYISGYNDFSVTWGTSGYNGYVCMFESLSDTTNVSYPSGYRREFYYVGGTYDPQQPVSSFTVNQSSGVYPLAVQFTDTSSHVPTGWNWNFGGTNTSTLQNPVYTFTEPGTYNVSLTVTKPGFSDSVSYATITVNNYVVPVAAFSCSPTNTTSPAVITCIDSSSNTPTSWLWHLTSYGVSMSPGGSYGAGIFDAVNSTQNPVFNMDGSGMVDVRLTVTNPGGSSQEYKANYITISGMVPTPTPTPAVPWPNQTGVCIGSAITLGSGVTRDHQEHYQLTDPYGDTYSGIYATGVTNSISSQPFFTALKGQYIYQETSTINGTLEWQQSYITDYCTTPTSTVTTTNIPVTAMPTVVNPYVTGGPTYNPYPVPTVTLINPNGTINVGSTWVNLTTIPTVLPPLPTGLNESHWREVTCSYGATGALLCPWLNVIYAIIGTASDFVFLLMSIGFLPLSFITNVYNFVSSLSLTILSSWLSVGSIIIAVMGQLVNALPDKVKNVVTLIMCLDIFKQCYELWDWVS